MSGFFIFVWAVFIVATLLKVAISVMQLEFLRSKVGTTAILMPQENYDEALRYAIEKERLSMVGHVAEFIFFGFWMMGGLALLEKNIGFTESNTFAVVFVMGFLAVSHLLELPFDIYKTFGLDKRFGFTKTTPSLYIKDELKSIVLFLVLGAPILFACSYIITELQNWWIWLFALLFSLVVVANFIYPTLIAPIFHKFTPLEEGELRQSIEKLLGDAGFHSKGVFTIDASQRDTRLNAYFAGFGRSKRVALYDTLIQKMDTVQINAVLAHELGHFRHKDVYKNLGATAAMLLFFCLLFGNLPSVIFQDIGIHASSGGVIVMFLLLSGTLSFFMMPLISAISKKNEFAADEYAAKSTNAKDMIDALSKLLNENKSFPLSHSWQSCFYHSHPTVPQRIERLEKKA